MAEMNLKDMSDRDLLIEAHTELKGVNARLDKINGRLDGGEDRMFSIEFKGQNRDIRLTKIEEKQSAILSRVWSGLPAWLQVVIVIWTASALVSLGFDIDKLL